MIYSYSKQFFLEVLISLARQWRYPKPINVRIDNEMAFFFQKQVLKQNPKDKQKKISSVGATVEEIFQFN